MSKQIEMPLLENLLHTGRAFATRETVTYPDGTRIEREVVVPEQRRAVPAVWHPTQQQVDWYRRVVHGGGVAVYNDLERELFYRIEAWERGLPYCEPPEEPVRFRCPAPCIGSRDRRY